MQDRLLSTVRFIVIALAIVAFGALSGWYYYLRTQSATTAQADQGRYAGSIAPSFNGTSGSTYENIVTGTIARIIDLAQGTPTDSATVSKLWHTERTPVAGAGFATTGTTTVLYYAQQGTGYLFSADPSGRTIERRSNVLLPKTYTAQFAYDGSFILQLIRDGAVRTIAGTMPNAAATTSTTTVSIGRELPSNIRTAALDPANRTLFWIANESQGGVSGVSASWGSTAGTKLFSSGIASWRPYMTGNGRLYVATAPADSVDGFAYEVRKDGTFASLVRAVPGLSILPAPVAGTFLYSSSGQGGVTLYAKTSASSTARELPLHTIAEKCVWLPGTGLIAYCAVPKDVPSTGFSDTWHQGALHTADDWWEIDIAGGTTREIYSPNDSDGRALDVVHPVIDKSGNYIAFIDGHDQSLWTLRVH